MPLERDEGEYAYMGQLLLHGVAPYKLAYSMKFPGSAAMYALFLAVFGDSTAAIRLGLSIANFVTVALIYFLGQRLLGMGIGALLVFVAVAMLARFVVRPVTRVLGWPI